MRQNGPFNATVARPIASVVAANTAALGSSIPAGAAPYKAGIQPRNNSFIRYNSLQINYNWRTRGGVTLLANYTLSKQIEEWGQ